MNDEKRRHEGLESDYKIHKRLEKKKVKDLKNLAKEEGKKDAKTPCNT